MDELIRLTARQAVAGLAKGEFTPLELIDAAERRVAAVDGDINALVTRCFDPGTCAGAAFAIAAIAG